MATERQDKKLTDLPPVTDLQGSDVLFLIRNGVAYQGTITDILLSGQVEGLSFNEINASTGNFTDIEVSGEAKIRTILGGSYGTHTIQTGADNAILAGSSHQVTGGNAIVGAGVSNEVYGNSSIIGAGINNTVDALSAGILAGQNNNIESQNTYGFIGAGFNNDINNQSRYAGIGGGYNNKIDEGDYSFIGGGFENESTGKYNFIGGGDSNGISGERSSIVGGLGNAISLDSDYSFIGGGERNTQDNEGSTHSVIGGGSGNQIIEGPHSVIVGGVNNSTSGLKNFVGGGQDNYASEEFSTIVGGHMNTARATGAFIGAGRGNDISGDSSYSSILNGRDNKLTGQHSVIIGGRDNSLHADHSTILGGQNNHIGAGADHSAIFGKNSLVRAGEKGALVLADQLGTSSSGENTLHAFFENGIFLNSEAGVTIDQLNRKQDFLGINAVAGGNLTVDFGREPFETISGLNTNMNFLYSNLPAEGLYKEKQFRIYTDGTARTFAFEEGVHHIGLSPTGLSANSMGLLTFKAFGPTSNQIVVRLEEEGV
tara:strand:+ start:101588 stop:103213 length:1626 start_codon:yes stop_codon:yes gene_type:complete